MELNNHWKNIENLDEKQLIKYIRNLYIQEDLDSLNKILDLSINKFPKSDKIVFEYGNFYYEEGNIDQAYKYIEASIKLNPNKISKKYLIMGQIAKYPNNIKYFEVAVKMWSSKINEITNQINNQTNEKLSKKLKNKKRNIAQAYSALGEIYLTNSENDKAFNNFNYSINYDKFYLEPYFQLIIYSSKIVDYQKFQEFSQNFIKILKEIKKENCLDLKDYDYNIFFTIIRMLQDCSMFEESSYICEIWLKNEVNNSEVLYLYSYSNFNLKNYDICWDSLEKLKELNYDGDKEIEEAALELYSQINNNDNQMIEEKDE